MTPDRCSACPGPPFRVVPSIGPAPCRVLFLGAGPGESEQKLGRPYVGPAGDEFTETYLTRAGLRRGDVHIGNAMQCWTGQKKIPPVDACVTCARHHLPALLDLVKPEVVVLMGGVTQHLADTRLKLDMYHGRPVHGSLLGGTWEGTIWCSYEPALGMRETSRMTQLIEDFKHLGQWLRGEWAPPVAPTGHPPRYELLHGEINGVRGRHDGSDWVAVDTETHGGKPWSMQWSSMRGTGYMLLAEDVRGLAKWEAYRREYDPTIILHNAPGDMDTLEKMGIHVTRFRDTMQEAYQAASLPQGLKPLAYRLLGITMHSWEDTVYPASIAAVVNWMEEALALAGTSLQDVTLTPLVMGNCQNCGKRNKKAACSVCGTPVNFTKTEYSAGTAASILRHVLTYTGKTETNDEPYDPWAALTRMKVEGLRGKKAEGWEFEWLEAELGPTPILGINNCDLESAVTYGCGDADATGRVAEALAVGRQDVRWVIDEGDVDV